MQTGTGGKGFNVNHISTSLLAVSPLSGPNTRARNLLGFSSARQSSGSGGSSHPRLQMFGLQEHGTDECVCLGGWGWGCQIPISGTFFFFVLYRQTAGLRTPFNPIKKDEQPKQAQAVRDEVFFFFFARTSAMLSFVLAQLLSPLPRFSVPVQFTPYNSLKVFDISKPSGPGVADVAGFVAT